MSDLLWIVTCHAIRNDSVHGREPLRPRPETQFRTRPLQPGEVERFATAQSEIRDDDPVDGDDGMPTTQAWWVSGAGLDYASAAAAMKTALDELQDRLRKETAP